MKVVNRLSHYLQTTLVTLILYYLDTGGTPTEKLPSWMSLYLLTYNQTEVAIFTCFPLFRVRRNPPKEKQGEWGFHCMPLETVAPVFMDNRKWTLRLIGSLLRIQNHCRYILQ